MRTKLIIFSCMILMLLNGEKAFAAETREHTSTTYDYLLEQTESTTRAYLSVEVPSAQKNYITYTPVVCDTLLLTEKSAFRNLPDDYYSSTVTIDEYYSVTVTPKSPVPATALANTKPFFEPNEYAINAQDPVGTYTKSLLIDEYAEFALLDLSINKNTSATANISEKGYGARDYNYSETNAETCINLFRAGTPYIIDTNGDTKLNGTQLTNTSDDLVVNANTTLSYKLNKNGSATIVAMSRSSGGYTYEYVLSPQINLPDAKNIRVVFLATQTTSTYDVDFASVAVNSNAYSDATTCGDNIFSRYDSYKSYTDPTTNAMPVITDKVITGHVLFENPTELAEKTIACQTSKYEVIYRYIRLFWYETDDPTASEELFSNNKFNNFDRELTIKQGYSGNFLLSLYDNFDGIINVYTDFEITDSSKSVISGIVPMYDDFINGVKQHGFVATEDIDTKSVYSEQLLIPESVMTLTGTYLTKNSISRPARNLTQTWLYNQVNLKTQNNESYYWFNINGSPTKSACGLYGLPNKFELLTPDSFLLTDAGASQNTRNTWLIHNTLPKISAAYIRVTIDVEVFESAEAQAQNKPLISRHSIEPLYLYYPLESANKGADEDKSLTIIK